MLVVGENISVVSKVVGDAVKDRNAEPIIKMAKEQKDAGADYIDVNIGPATKKGEELMQWIVKSIQDKVNTPLALDTKNISAIEAGLEVHKGTAMINSVTGDKDKLDILMPLSRPLLSSIRRYVLLRRLLSSGGEDWETLLSPTIVLGSS
ncbi:unnamed protein product, partial [marine sediment metagenome]